MSVEKSKEKEFELLKTSTDEIKSGTFENDAPKLDILPDVAPKPKDKSTRYTPYATSVPSFVPSKTS